MSTTEGGESPPHRVRIPASRTEKHVWIKPPLKWDHLTNKAGYVVQQKKNTMADTYWLHYEHKIDHAFTIFRMLCWEREKVSRVGGG